MLPDADGTVQQFLKTDGSGNLAFAFTVVSGTLVAATGQTELTFTGIPAWVKKITIGMSGLSTSGSVIPLLQVGTSSGYITTGYTGAVVAVPAASATDTTGFPFANAWANTYLTSGQIVLSRIDAANNTWVCAGLHLLTTAAAMFNMAGHVSLAAALDRVRLRMDGSNTFDAGSVNILYE